MVQPRRADASWQLPSCSSLSVAHHGDASPSTQTSESGQLTPATGSGSELSHRDSSDGQGKIGRNSSPQSPRRLRNHNRSLPLPSSSSSEAYELEEFHDDAAVDFHGESAIDDEDFDDGNDEGVHSGARRKGVGGAGRWDRGKSSRRLSDSTVASFQLYTPDEEKAVVRKFDRKLVVFLAFCYMMSFVDRSNIGNARIAGMEADLQSKPPQENFFEWAIRAFYISYIAFEWMSLLWRIVPAHVYVSLIVLSWGVVASLQAVATSYPMLIALRVLLGVGEAGFTGVPFYLSFFFKRNELAFRTALFISAAPLASAFAGFLAWAILWIGKSLPIASWRLLFLIEGFPSVIISTIAWGAIPDPPETASYLSPRERKVAKLRLRHEHMQEQSQDGPYFNGTGRPSPTPTSGLKAKDVLAAFRDPAAWLTAFMFFLANMAYSTLPTFLPTILEDMGHSKLEAEALSAPPNVVAFGIVLLTAHMSDRAQSRFPYVAAHALLSASGYLVLALARPAGLGPMVRYAAVYPAAVGFFSTVVLIISWSVNNQPGEGRRGVGFALLQVVGQCGPLVGAQLYPDREGPYFETGMWACASAMLGVALLSLLLRVYLARLNGRLDEKEGKTEEGGSEEIQGLVECGRQERTGFRYLL